VPGDVLEAAAAFWSVVPGVLGVCAGGFTGALAEAALALLEPAASGVVPLAVELGLEELGLEALVEDAALCVLEAAEPVASAAPIAPEDEPVFEDWLLVHESEIMFTELTCTEPSLAREPCIWT